MKKLTEKDIVFSQRSLMDPVGRVFFFENRVFRAIYNPCFASFYGDILKKDYIKNLFKGGGLVKTWVCDDIDLPNASLILEHEKISFVTLPCEWTEQMFWQAVKAMVDVNLELSYKGLLLKDSHLFNMFYHFGSPIFVDFGSIISSGKISSRWMHEFITYALVPLWISKTRWRDLSLEYRREHTVGFGINLFKRKIIRYFLFRNFLKLKKYRDNSTFFFKELIKIIENYRPAPSCMEKWSKYDQSHLNDPVVFREESLLTRKQQFVFDILKKARPVSVVDCAANKGYYAEMAASLGASVVAFDREEFCVDVCRKNTEGKKIDITSIIMDFRRPTPSFGHGLVGDDAFTRFNVDIVLSLGLIHHLCLKDNCPVKLFCDICSNYATKGVVLEFVEIGDKHVENWPMKAIPVDYSLEKIISYFSKKFSCQDVVENNIDGLRRKLIYFGSK